jgi:hypothetical protein
MCRNRETCVAGHLGLEHASAADHSVGGSSSGAALPSQRECSDEMDEDSEGSEEEIEDENGTNSDGSFSDDGFPSSAGRVRQATGNSSGAAGPEGPSKTAPGLRSQEPSDAVSGPATCLTAAAVQERAAAMFIVGACSRTTGIRRAVCRQAGDHGAGRARLQRGDRALRRPRRQPKENEGVDCN